jgi:hypothetical protein
MADVLQADLREALIACAERRAQLEATMLRDEARRPKSPWRLSADERQATLDRVYGLERVDAWLRGHLRDTEEEREF